MKARVTATVDVNALALARMLTENGLWLVEVHNRRIVKATKVPRPSPVDELLAGGPAPVARDI
jgi:hypothetical protein